MAVDLQALAVEQAELLSVRLKELMSSSQGYIRAQFGLDPGLEPDLYPTWVILSTALLLLLALSWAGAAVCGGLFAGKKRGSLVTQASGEPLKARFTKPAKAEDQKKRNKKKSFEKNQSNGQPVTVAEEEVEVIEAASKPSPEIRTEKVHMVQAPVQVKKNKKKTKADVKSVRIVSTTDGKEPDDGAWETKVSNREKRQQRRKDRGPEDSGSPGGVEGPKNHVEAPVVPPANTRKSRGNHESLQSRNSGKGDADSGPVSSSWREEPSVNGRGWADVSLKSPGQMGTVEGDKWTSNPTAPRHRAQPERRTWGQETQVTWSGIDERMKTDLNPVTFSMLGLNTTEPISNSLNLKWASHTNVDDEWSGFNGMAAADPSSDWNAPVEHWGNYEEAPVLVTPAAPANQNKVSEDEKDSEDPAGGAAKSKKKKKKKKKVEDEAAVTQTVNSVPLVANMIPKPQEPPAVASNKLPPNMHSSQKKSEQVVEPPKASQKKKVRKET